MEVNGNVITLEAGEEITIKAKKKDVQPQPEPQPQPSGKYLSFSELLAQMNAVLKNFGFKEVSKSGTPKTYDYLVNADKMASAAWDDTDSWMWKKDSYKEIYDYHGTDKTYKYEAANCLGASLMASCLAELCPTSGEKTNCQTELFKLAYEIGGGRAVPITGLDMHCDPMIARNVACALYSTLHKQYTWAQIDAMRKELGGKAINASDWNGLGYKGDDGAMTYLGYIVNTDAIIPAAAGWFADGCDNGRVKPWEEGQPKDKFLLGDYSKPWYKYNYNDDVVCDRIITSDYNMQAQTTLEEWNSYTKEKKQLIIQASAAVRATDHFFFGKKYVKFDGIHMGSRAGNNKEYQYFWFSETNEKPTATNDVFEIRGCFYDLEDKMFVGSGYGTPTDALKYMSTVMKIADNGRAATVDNQYGRVRPCGGQKMPTDARSEIKGDKLNAIYNVDISCIFADDEAQYNKCYNTSGFVYEFPRSYVSGHTTQTWVGAMLLAQMNPSTLQKYWEGACMVATSRNITRYHWLSDVIYGRMIGCMIVPIINAMSGLQSGFDKAKDIVNGVTPVPTPSGKTPATVISFKFKIKNNKKESVTIDDNVNFVLANPDKNGFYYGGKDGTPYIGWYNRWKTPLVGNGKKITIAAGKEATFTLKPSESSNIFNADGSLYGNNVINGFGGRNLVSKADMDKNGWNKDRGYTNVLLYQDGYSNKVVPEFMDADVVFVQGNTYTAIIK